VRGERELGALGGKVVYHHHFFASCILFTVAGLVVARLVRLVRLKADGMLLARPSLCLHLVLDRLCYHPVQWSLGRHGRRDDGNAGLVLGDRIDVAWTGMSLAAPSAQPGLRRSGKYAEWSRVFSKAARKISCVTTTNQSSPERQRTRDGGRLTW
jgi:hypothetical protein